MFIGSENIDLHLVLIESAQCFHWSELPDGSFVAVVDGKPVRLWRESDGVHAEGGMSAPELRRYLDLDRDYAAIAREYESIPAARRAIELYSGLRVLNQSPWEALVQFILSANNHAPRIRGLVEELGRALGPEFEIGGATVYGIPSPGRLLDCEEEELRAMGVGYRASYLTGSALAVAEGFPLDELSEMDCEDAHELLTTLPGVGDKVADCVLLFGCGQASAFPVDVWVERLLKRWFGIDCGGNRAKMAREARSRLGERAGILQQFLFHAARMGDMEL